MKVEPLMKSKDDEILKMEIFVLKKIQNFPSCLPMFSFGKNRFLYICSDEFTRKRVIRDQTSLT
ncbi:hypothetical protein COOONC_07138 [Cooperia oncophora]